MLEIYLVTLSPGAWVVKSGVAGGRWKRAIRAQFPHIPHGLHGLHGMLGLGDCIAAIAIVASSFRANTFLCLM